MEDRQWLKNVDTGGIWPWTEKLAKQSYMIPCSSPDLEEEVPGPEHVMKLQAADKAAEPEKEEDDSGLLSKEEGKVLVKKYFGRNVSQVTKTDMIAFAKEEAETDLDENLTKLEMITQIAEVMAGREE